MRIALPLSLLAALCMPRAIAAEPLAKEQREASIRYVQGLRNADGGFRASGSTGPSTLGSTSSSLRALKYLGAGVTDPQRTAAFIAACAHPSGGLADVPGGAPDVRTTAVGLMALVELHGPRLRESVKLEPIVGYLETNARAIPELYIAAAALDAAGLKTARAPEWLAAFEATRNADGTFGKGVGDTAGAAITALRLGRTVNDPAATAASLKAAQRPDGGFAGMGEASDLGSTYRVMRALWMLREKPDVARLRAFVARCRNADGGYGAGPGQPSGASPTYYASIVLKWADEMEK
ncbi:MAG TPA: prenyltransferase/squalene oxidase repeat-containing protein [Armatimonadota bacterium]|nr:prenyltransferase/squalene oxidase repeat-containing protein [Armatimonadota bacterium]